MNGGESGDVTPPALASPVLSLPFRYEKRPYTIEKEPQQEAPWGQWANYTTLHVTRSAASQKKRKIRDKPASVST